MIRVELTIQQTKTLLRLLRWAYGKAEMPQGVMAEIDSLCRTECANQWRNLYAYLNGKLPKKYRL